jgi:hypothetical protein
LRERLRFEPFLADLALRFQRLPANQLDDAIGESLRALVETLAVDRATIMEIAEDGKSHRFAIGYARPGIPPPEYGLDQATALPWYTEQVLGGKRLVVRSPEELPAEATGEREGRFRADLFYRLSVFPLTMPPLRHRPEDIPLLVWHFVSRKQIRLGHHLERVPDRLMRAFRDYAWPGNIRELENVVERALILSNGTALAIDPLFPGARRDVAPPARSGLRSDVERRHLLDVVEHCGWKVAGKGNAAERLGLKRDTLMFRMKKLGISRPG